MEQPNNMGILEFAYNWEAEERIKRDVEKNTKEESKTSPQVKDKDD